MRKVIVIGGWAAGLMAAGRAAERGADVLLLEKNRLVGRKLQISGKGRCNLANDTEINDLLANVPTNPKFLRSALHRFGPKDTQHFFTNLGMKLKVERGNRVFPESDNAEDVVDALRRHCINAGVEVNSSVTVRRIGFGGGSVSGVELAGGAFIPADAVILATGGSSYPATGSTGDGYRMAQELGHTIAPLHPGLVPIVTEETWPAQAQGLALRNVTLTTFSPTGKKLRSEIGEMLFAHFGVTGPLILTASSLVGDKPGSRLVIDLKPGLSEQKLDERLQRDFLDNARRLFGNALAALLPTSIIPVIVTLSRIGPHSPVSQITREQRLALVQLLKHLTLTVKGTLPLSDAIITAGGVNVSEINSTTMESKIIKGLYFAGEVIDVDAFTGGFNLQIAWSTGHLAGESAAVSDTSASW
ncbi:MAG: NAD(P)/FAD-dependent oxidoreductase [bacterium]